MYKNQKEIQRAFLMQWEKNNTIAETKEVKFICPIQGIVNKGIEQ